MEIDRPTKILIAVITILAFSLTFAFFAVKKLGRTAGPAKTAIPAAKVGNFGAPPSPQNSTNVAPLSSTTQKSNNVTADLNQAEKDINSVSSSTDLNGADLDSNQILK